MWGMEFDMDGWIRGRQGSRKPREMSLYVLTESGAEQPCKIGSAVDVARRICTLNSGNSRPLVLRAAAKVTWHPDEKWLAYQRRVQGMERALHARFKGVRLRGEWFVLHWEAAAQAIAQ